MCPGDATPLSDAMTHRFPEQKIPQNKPGAQERRGGHRIANDKPLDAEADVSQRPPLPDHRPPPGGQRD